MQPRGNSPFEQAVGDQYGKRQASGGWAFFCTANKNDVFAILGMFSGLHNMLASMLMI